MTEAAQQYYQQLYTPEDIDYQAVEQLLQSVPTDILSDNATQRLFTSPFTLDQIVEGARRAPCNSSPGSDGLPYPILYLLFFILYLETWWLTFITQPF